MKGRLNFLCILGASAVKMGFAEVSQAARAQRVAIAPAGTIVVRPTGKPDTQVQRAGACPISGLISPNRGGARTLASGFRKPWTADYGERDTLTGLLNRKTFEASFDKLRARARNSSRTPGSNDPSWLGVVDIDNFKSINDTYGHLFGDEVLLLVARLMKQNFRGADQLFRFGGEEFVIVLDRATEVGAEIAFNRLRATVESYKFPQVGRVTISLGYTRVDPIDAPASCVDRADAALYYAKHRGRNMTCGYEKLIASGLLAAKEARAEVELF